MRVTVEQRGTTRIYRPGQALSLGFTATHRTVVPYVSPHHAYKGYVAFRFTGLGALVSLHPAGVPTQLWSPGFPQPVAITEPSDYPVHAGAWITAGDARILVAYSALPLPAATPLDATEQRLLDAVAADLHDDDARRVLADYWLEHGDPRGQLVMLQDARKPDADVIDDHAKAWLHTLIAADLVPPHLVRGFAPYPLVAHDGEPILACADARRVSPRMYRTSGTRSTDPCVVVDALDHAGAKVVVKVPADDRVRRVPAEAARLEAARHPHVVAFREVAQTRLGKALVLEDAGAIVPDGHLATRQVESVGRQIADALAAVHARGLVHGAPVREHIVLDANGHARLAGFGHVLRNPRQVLGWRPEDDFRVLRLALMQLHDARGEEWETIDFAELRA